MTWATALPVTDILSAEQAVARLIKVALTQGQFDALVDFVFNLGAGRLAPSTLLKMLNAGNTTGAGQQLLLWVYAGGVKQPGLVTRREAELALWDSQ